jgi:tetrahydromethanopterin S-methyltransferase subunit F
MQNQKSKGKNQNYGIRRADEKSIENHQSKIDNLKWSLYGRDAVLHGGCGGAGICGIAGV